MTDSMSPVRKRALIIATGVFAAIALVAVIAWFIHGTRYVTTENAYVDAGTVVVTALAPAPVRKVDVNDTDVIKAGDVLVELDDTDARLLVVQAKAALQMVKGKVRTHYADSSLSGRSQANGDLIDRGALTDHPEIVAAQAKLEQAQANEDRMEIRAPVGGIVAKSDVGTGQFAVPGVPLMSIVPIDAAYVTANFKEVQLRKVAVGQAVELTSDLYGKGVKFHGKVAGISGGTGATLALIPAQNATGNWIKVVQRIPVRITLDPAELKAHPLRIGMTMTATIDTGK